MTIDLHKTPRLYVRDPALAEGVRLDLPQDQAHYLAHVLRVQTGDSVRVFNEKCGEWRGVVDLGGKKHRVAVDVAEKLRTPKAEAALTLCCAPIKKAHFDFMVMKATELGVTCIAPLLTARTQVREVNVERCQAIAVEAAEQSERLSVPVFLPPMTFEKSLAAWPQGRLPLVCAEFGDALPVHEALSRLTPPLPPSVAVITGPEGGFTPEEMEQLRLLPQALPVRLGPRILRADTAALAALACWQAVCGDWR